MPEAVYNPHFTTALVFEPTFMARQEEQKIAHYTALKQHFIDHFDALCAEHPTFQPRIRYNDDKKTIEIGHGYDELVSLLAGNGDLLSEVKKTKPYQLSGNMTFAPMLLGARNGSELTKQGEDKAFVYDALHNDFYNKLRAFMQKPPARDYAIEAPEVKRPQEIISQFARKAHAAAQPLRLVVGENHEQVVARRLLIEAMPDLKRQNATLCLEHFFYDTQQQTLDAWIKDPAASMPLELKLYTAQLDREYGLGGERTGFMDVLNAAKANGVRILAIDTEAARAIKTGPAGGSGRVSAMNYIASHIIEKEVGKGSFVSLTGNSHCAKLISKDGSRPVVGLDTLCNAVSLSISEERGALASLEAAKQMDTDRESTQPDYVFKADRQYVPHKHLSTSKSVC